LGDSLKRLFLVLVSMEFDAALDIQCAGGGPMAVEVTVEIIGLGWLGTRTRHAGALVDFYSRVLGMQLTHEEPGFWVFTLPSGYNVEVFDVDRGKEHFTTGPVAGFAVRDFSAAVQELRAAGVELIGDPGPTWQQFRGPDGNVYELVAAQEPQEISDTPGA
jgi:catechol 2,3-dioxygenase-like lactoylglutathione lyase family enzyme